MKIITTYDIGQTVHIKTDRFSQPETVDCPTCNGLGRVKGTYGGVGYCGCDNGKVTIRKKTVEAVKVIGIEASTYAQGLDPSNPPPNAPTITMIYYRLRHPLTMRDLCKIPEKGIYLTPEEAEKGVVVP
jgi:hypothetical protein